MLETGVLPRYYKIMILYIITSFWSLGLPCKHKITTAIFSFVFLAFCKLKNIKRSPRLRLCDNDQSSMKRLGDFRVSNVAGGAASKFSRIRVVRKTNHRYYVGIRQNNIRNH